MALQDFLPALASQIGEISGIDGNVFYPDIEGGDKDLPSRLLTTPCVTIIPLTGAQMFGGSYIATHQLEVVFYVCPSYTPATLGLAVPYIKRMRDKLASRMQLGLSSIVQHASSSPGNFYEGPRGYTYAEEPFTGIKFFIEVKESDPFTLAA